MISSPTARRHAACIRARTGDGALASVSLYKTRTGQGHVHVGHIRGVRIAQPEHHLRAQLLGHGLQHQAGGGWVMPWVHRQQGRRVPERTSATRGVRVHTWETHGVHVHTCARQPRACACACACTHGKRKLTQGCSLGHEMGFTFHHTPPSHGQHWGQQAQES